MAVNQYMDFILSLTFTVSFIQLSCACDLVPLNDGSCFELTASTYITYGSSQFGPTIEGARYQTFY